MGWGWAELPVIVSQPGCSSMSGTHLFPPPCLPSSNELVLEPAGLQAASPHGLELRGNVWDGPVSWDWCLKLQPGMGSAGPHRSRDSPSCSMPHSLARRRLGGWRQPGGAQQHPELQHQPRPSNTSSLSLLAQVPAAVLGQGDLQEQGDPAQPGICRHNRAVANRQGGGQLGSRGAHRALCAAAAPWADPPRALGCRG